MRIKRVFITSIIILLLSTPIALFAETHTSPNYTLTRARVVNSGGNAESAAFILDHVSIGNICGGIAESANYHLDTASLDILLPSKRTGRAIGPYGRPEKI